MSSIACVLAAYSWGPNLLVPASANIIDVDVRELDITHRVRNMKKARTGVEVKILLQGSIDIPSAWHELGAVIDSYYQLDSCGTSTDPAPPKSTCVDTVHWCSGGRLTFVCPLALLRWISGQALQTQVEQLYSYLKQNGKYLVQCIIENTVRCGNWASFFLHSPPKETQHLVEWTELNLI